MKYLIGFSYEWIWRSLYKSFEKLRAKRNYRYLFSFSTMTSSFELNFRGFILLCFSLVVDFLWI